MNRLLLLFTLAGMFLVGCKGKPVVVEDHKAQIDANSAKALSNEAKSADNSSRIEDLENRMAALEKRVTVLSKKEDASVVNISTIINELSDSISIVSIEEGCRKSHHHKDDKDDKSDLVLLLSNGMSLVIGYNGKVSYEEEPRDCKKEKHDD